MIPLSARTQDALTLSAQQLRDTLSESEIDLYTLAGNLSRRAAPILPHARRSRFATGET